MLFLYIVRCLKSLDATQILLNVSEFILWSVNLSRTSTIYLLSIPAKKTEIYYFHMLEKKSVLLRFGFYLIYFRKKKEINTQISYLNVSYEGASTKCLF